MNDVDKFVHDASSELQKEFRISSFSLKKAFDKEIKKKYSGTGLFINYSKEG